MALSHLAQDFHRELIVIGRDIGFFENRRRLELARRHFVVTGLDRNAELVELKLHFAHERLNASRDRAEVMIFELLALRRLTADQRTAGHDKIRAQDCRTRDRSGNILARHRASARRA